MDPDCAKAWLGQGLLADMNGDKEHARALFAHAVTLSAGSLVSLSERCISIITDVPARSRPCARCIRVPAPDQCCSGHFAPQRPSICLEALHPSTPSRRACATPPRTVVRAPRARRRGVNVTRTSRLTARRRVRIVRVFRNGASVLRRAGESRPGPPCRGPARSSPGGVHECLGVGRIIGRRWGHCLPLESPKQARTSARALLSQRRGSVTRSLPSCSRRGCYGFCGEERRGGAPGQDAVESRRRRC